MTKHNRERIIKAIEEHNKNTPESRHLDVYEVFDEINSITDEEANEVIAEIESNYKN